MLGKFSLIVVLACCLQLSLQQRPDYCYLKPDSGTCESHVLSYYYNPAHGDCETFIYGGCDGNFNRFNSHEQCAHFCMHIREVRA
ncbi:kunitz-type serine protease inhibitor PPTI-like [Physella acuta]|uniref:kunitz-type serine protease inhibitor PPTI-like n=1 Tax=Physella acuta TaxID=109671 RepID=UPI0027DCA5CC|nr:kunitz-type serine protease inhibitor PPTI-like [Physella acuta]